MSERCCMKSATTRRLDRIAKTVAAPDDDLDPDCVASYLADAGIDPADADALFADAAARLRAAGDPRDPVAVATILAVPPLHPGDILAEADQLLTRCRSTRRPTR